MLSILRHIICMNKTRRLFSSSPVSSYNLLGIGQPYLEYNVSLSDDRIRLIKDYIEKLQADTETKLSTGQIFNDLIKNDSILPNYDSPILLPGGSIVNIVRMARWLIRQECSTSFIGCVGNDLEAEILKDLLAACKIDPILGVSKHEKTGKMLNLIIDSEETIGETKSLRLIDQPGASSILGTNILENIDARIRFSTAKFVLTSLPPKSKEKMILKIADVTTSMNKMFCLKLPCCNGDFPDDYLTAKEWLNLFSHVDILFLDLNSALKIAKIFSNWQTVMSAEEKPQSIRPDVKKRFEEFTDNLKLDENAIYSMSLSLAATMPSLAERLAISLAHLPRRNGKKTRLVFLMNCGTSTGGIVACSNHNQIFSISDFPRNQIFGEITKYIASQRKYRKHEFSLSSSDGKDRMADAFVAGVLTLLLNGHDFNSERFIEESLTTGAKLAQYIDSCKDGTFPKILPHDLNTILSENMF